MSVKTGLVKRRSLVGKRNPSSPGRRHSPTKKRRSMGGGVGGSSDSSSSNIRVSIRVRPLNAREESDESARNIIEVVDESLLIFDPKVEDEDFYFRGKRQRRRDLNKRPQKDHKFAFDRVFDPETDNEQVFEGTTKSLVDSLFNGYNSSAFVYGATGAGKTFTMLGSGGNPGIIYRTVEAVYQRVEVIREDTSCEITVSYLEIYNENVVDLINPGGIPLNIREDGHSGVNIPGLTRHKPTSPEELLKLLQYGNSNRSQHPTDANAESSRSHAVFQVFLKQQNRSSGLSAEVKLAKLSMIDLAGSERGTVTSNRESQRKKEGANINKSLLALGNCINALSEGSKYIPYRNSKLTRMLKDSIGGNCQTVMISNVSPSSKTYEDTYNTLKYADRAKRIKVKLRKNVLSVDFHVAQYAKIVEELKQEVSELKEKLIVAEGRIQNSSFVQPQQEQTEKFGDLKGRLNEALKELDEKQLVSEEKAFAVLKDFEGMKMALKNLLDIESEIKLSQVDVLHGQNVVERINMIAKIFETPQVGSALKNTLKTLDSRRKKILELEAKKSCTMEEYLNEKDKFEQANLSINQRRFFEMELKSLQDQMSCQHLLRFQRVLASEKRKESYLTNLYLPSMLSALLQLKSLNKYASNYNELQAIVDRFCGNKVSWDEELMKTTNCETEEELLGIAYSSLVSLSQTVPEFSNAGLTEKVAINDIEQVDDITVEPFPKEVSDPTDELSPVVRPPTPPKKSKSSGDNESPTIFEMSMERCSPIKETQEICCSPTACSDMSKDISNCSSTVKLKNNLLSNVIESSSDLGSAIVEDFTLNPASHNLNSPQKKVLTSSELSSVKMLNSPCKVSGQNSELYSIHEKNSPKKAAYTVSRLNLPHLNSPKEIVLTNSELNLTSVISSPKKAILKNAELDSTHILDSPMKIAQKSLEPHSADVFYSLDKSVKENTELNCTHVIDSPKVMTVASVDLNSTRVISSSRDQNNTDLNSTRIIEPYKASNDEIYPDKSILRETFSLIKPTVAVQPNIHCASLDNVSSNTFSLKHGIPKPMSRTPPALGVAEPKRKLKPSKSMSRLLTSSDVRLGPTNKLAFRRPINSLTSSAPNYMSSTTASFNKLSKQKENQKPSVSNVQTNHLSRSGSKLSQPKHIRKPAN